MAAAPRLRIEHLEDRAIPAVFGNPWPNAEHLTLSFVPDGTDVGGTQSELFRTLDTQMPTATWQQEITRAFQTWAQQTNLNFSVVSDNGKPLGEPGPIQGSAWFGDIRISARPLSDNVLAVSNPFDMFNSWAGEIIINSNKLFGQGNTRGRYDLFTVALQEAGHVLGLDNSPDTASVMYTHYTTARSALSATDIATVQQLYGVRSADRFDQTGANNTLATADRLSFVTDTDRLDGTDGTWGGTPFVAQGDLTTRADVDYYSVEVPDGSSGFTVSLLTEGISLLRAKVSVYDLYGNLVTSGVAPSGQGKPFELFVSGAKTGDLYRVKVEAATTGAFGVGSYRLAIGNEATEAVVPPVIAGYQNPDGHTNDTLKTATHLGMARAGTDLRWDAIALGSIYNANQTDVDFYKIMTKRDTPKVMVVAVWASEVGTLDPRIQVFDSDMNPVAAEVLSSNGSYVILQVTGVAADKSYFIQVGAKDPNSTSKEGNYTLAVDFRDMRITPTTFATGTLEGSNTEAFTTFEVNRSQSVYFELAGTGSADVAVRMTVYDSDNQAVLTLVAKGGEVVGQDVLLAPGTYTVGFVAAYPDGGSLPAFQFRGRYLLSSDPIGPELIDTTAAAPTTPTATPTTSTTTTATSSPSPTYVPYLAPSTVYTSPVGVSTTDPIVWTSPTTTSYPAVRRDSYSYTWQW